MRYLHELVDHAAAKDGARAALVLERETVTYAELRAALLETAAGFSSRGVRAGDRVALVHRNSPHFIVAYLALSRLGAVAVPINFMITKPDELAYMLNDCRVVGAVSQREFLKSLRAAALKTPSLKTIWVSDFSSEECGPNEESFAHLRTQGEPPAISRHEDDTVAILYTSGTTGSPKGVMLTHRNLLSNCESAIARLGLSEKDVPLCLLPMFHAFAWVGNVLIALRLGTKLVIAPAVIPAAPWLKQMARHGVTFFSAVPQIYGVLAKEAAGLKRILLRHWYFRKVRGAVSGAAPLNPAIQKAFEENLKVPLLEGYGLTEVSLLATINTFEQRKSGSVGLPIGGVRVKIVDEREREVSIGEEGEICVMSSGVMKGYHDCPQATREAFTADGWFKSGDIGTLDDEGFLYLRDRKKDMIIIKGLKVFPAQLEAALLEHPAVQEAAIIGVPDEVGDEKIKAFVVLRSGATADKAALKTFCRERFDSYKRPRDIEIVDSLPKNALQKVLKRALRERKP